MEAIWVTLNLLTVFYRTARSFFLYGVALLALKEIARARGCNVGPQDMEPSFTLRLCEKNGILFFFSVWSFSTLPKLLVALLIIISFSLDALSELISRDFWSSSSSLYWSKFYSIFLTSKEIRRSAVGCCLSIFTGLMTKLSISSGVSWVAPVDYSWRDNLGVLSPYFIFSGSGSSSWSLARDKPLHLCFSTEVFICNNLI
mgnify:CR=1 FL=1